MEIIIYDFLLQIFLARLNSFSHSLEYIAESRSNNQKARRIIYCIPKMLLDISLMTLSSCFLCAAALIHITTDMMLLFMVGRSADNNFVHNWTHSYRQIRAELNRNQRQRFDSTIFSAPIRFINTYHAAAAYCTRARERNNSCMNFRRNQISSTELATSANNNHQHNGELLQHARNAHSSQRNDSPLSVATPPITATSANNNHQHNGELLQHARNAHSSQRNDSPLSVATPPITATSANNKPAHIS